jgi:hypothetical protein
VEVAGVPPLKSHKYVAPVAAFVLKLTSIPAQPSVSSATISTNGIGDAVTRKKR